MTLTQEFRLISKALNKRENRVNKESTNSKFLANRKKTKSKAKRRATVYACVKRWRKRHRKEYNAQMRAYRTSRKPSI